MEGLPYLLTTQGGVVEVHQNSSELREFFGAIDSPEEAYWIARSHGYLGDFNPCAGAADQFTEDERGYSAVGEIDRGCDYGGSAVDLVSLTVDASANVTEGEILRSQNSCAIPGRRPPGLYARGPGDGTLGAYFAGLAHHESAAVLAFERLGLELAQLHAPACLVEGALTAAHDERRHARVMARLARRFGASPLKAAAAPAAPRGLQAIALDNAIEGCVNESLSALQARFQAEAASDPHVAFAFRSIAADEIRHAAWSWRLAACCPPPRPRSRSRWTTR